MVLIAKLRLSVPAKAGESPDIIYTSHCLLFYFNEDMTVTTSELAGRLYLCVLQSGVALINIHEVYLLNECTS